jgi:hypothetical protein
MLINELKQQLQLALAEIGPIEPWWAEDSQMWCFEHPLYPACMHLDPDKQATIDGYLRALEGFIEERLNNTVADFMETATKGQAGKKGGKRAGAGRPRNATTTAAVRLPLPLVEWLKNPANRKKLETLMQQESS